MAALLRRRFERPPRELSYCQAFIVGGREVVASAILIAEEFLQLIRHAIELRISIVVGCVIMKENIFRGWENFLPSVQDYPACM